MLKDKEICSEYHTCHMEWIKIFSDWLGLLEAASRQAFSLTLGHGVQEFILIQQTFSAENVLHWLLHIVDIIYVIITVLTFRISVAQTELISVLM